MCNAATVLQKSWRRAQNRLMLKHLRIEKIVRDRAATVIQAHVRGHSSRCELRKMSCAVLRIQNCWRQYRSVQEVLVVAAAIQQAEERRLHAAITLQAYARGFVVRQELVRMHKSATTIQRQWKAHKDICSRAAIKLQAYVRGFSVRLKYAMHKKAMVEERAAILIQACVRGHLVRCHLTILHTAALIIQLQWRRYSRSCRFEAAAPLVVHGAVSEREILTLSRADSHLQSGHGHVRVEKDVEMEFFNERALKNEEDEVLNSKEGLQPSPELSPLEKMVDITVVQQIDQREKTEEKAGEKGPDIALLSRRDDFGLRPLLNGELPAFPTGELPVGKVSQNEDWNDVSIDHLDECLDTCLASLKPLPVDLSASVISADQCFPKFVILEEGHPSQQKNSNDRSSGYLSVNGTESVKVVTPAKAEAKTTSHSAPRLQRASSRKGVKHEISKDVPSNSSNGYLNQTTLSSRDSLQPAHGSSAKLKRDSQTKVETHQVGETECGNKGQGKSRYTEDLKRNEERLQQFAQVFLLQRHIAYQQQRAQSAPPFPLPALAGSGSSQDSQVGQRDICTESGIPERDSDSVVLKVHHNAIQRQPRNTQNNLDRGNVYRTDTSSSPGQEPVSNHNGAVPFVKHHRQTPGTDVVVDMVLLLRKVEEVYGTSDVVIAESSSSCFPARSGDIEEGGPVVDRRKKSSTLGFTKSISMRQIGLPNVNAMLLVIIAMVVYTRTICQGVIFGHRQTHRKI
ncbi:hypothetical protein Mapa_016473 [Marchantia paleacea]|nr:hypothetical protein Mapa_016473 [Marchantia paleacea]